MTWNDSMLGQSQQAVTLMNAEDSKTMTQASKTWAIKLWAGVQCGAKGVLVKGAKALQTGLQSTSI